MKITKFVIGTANQKLFARSIGSVTYITDDIQTAYSFNDRNTVYRELERYNLSPKKTYLMSKGLEPHVEIPNPELHVLEVTYDVHIKKDQG